MKAILWLLLFWFLLAPFILSALTANDVGLGERVVIVILLWIINVIIFDKFTKNQSKPLR